MEKMRKCDAETRLYIPPDTVCKESDMNKVDHFAVVKECFPKEERTRSTDNSNWRRQRMTSEIIQELEVAFAYQPKPSRSEIEQMATRFGQRENNIYAWFYRRRNRDVREADTKSTDSADDEAAPAKRAAESSPPPRTKAQHRRRNSRISRFFNKEEQTVLENVFARQNYPGDSEIDGLARWFQKDQRKVSAWFARRRMKFTKDFVKNIDMDSFVSPVPNSDGQTDGASEGEETKYINADSISQRPAFSSRYFSRSKDLKTQYVEDEDEECDVERLSPIPMDKENYRLSCLTCATPQNSSPKLAKQEFEETKTSNRESVIQWRWKPNKVERQDKPNVPSPLVPSIGGVVIPPSDVTYCCAPSVSKNTTGTSEPPGLLPIEWLVKFPQIFSFGQSLNRLPYCGAVPQWYTNPLNNVYKPIPHSAGYAPGHTNQDLVRLNEGKTIIKKE